MDDKISKFAEAIKVHEGWKPGSVAYRNNNPGNIVYGPLAVKHNAKGFWTHPTTKHQFAIFPTYEDGFACLKELLMNAFSGKSQIYKPEMTILEFFTKYSPVRDAKGKVIPNVAYATAVAKTVGVPITYQIKYLYDINFDQKNMSIKIENQLDPKWSKYYIGKVKTSSFAKYACFLFSLTYMYSVKRGKQISPAVVDEMFMKNGVYSGDMIISEKAAKVLGLQYFGIEGNINKGPDWAPSIKQVDYSILDGRQTHFVVRTKDASGGNIILDPLGGVQRKINFYERKVNDLEWKSKYFSYRKFKI